MNHWIATDLDGTLFSRAWAAPDAVPATWRIEPATGDRAPSSWMHPAIHRTMIALQQIATLVPVTARDADSFARVDIRGIPLTGLAVIANGAVVLNCEGRPDAIWETEMIRRLEPWQGWLDERLDLLLEMSRGHARPRLVDGPPGLSAYLVAKAETGWWESDTGRGIRGAIDWTGCRLSLLGNELQVLPPGVGKLDALSEVMERHFGGCRPMLCFGDMPADLDFMRFGEILATPRQSVLEKAWPKS
jgi:hydroxymethylpyrimidine pyrophosphatase-like HAD family hydrolase